MPLSSTPKFTLVTCFDENPINKSQFISPIVGVNYKNFMFSYTYTNQIDSVVLSNSGFHQITLGLNLWTKEKTWPSVDNADCSDSYS